MEKNVIDVGGGFRITAEFAIMFPTLAKLITFYMPLLKQTDLLKVLG